MCEGFGVGGSLMNLQNLKQDVEYGEKGGDEG